MGKIYNNVYFMIYRYIVGNRTFQPFIKDTLRKIYSKILNLIIAIVSFFPQISPPAKDRRQRRYELV